MREEVIILDTNDNKQASPMSPVGSQPTVGGVSSVSESPAGLNTSGGGNSSSFATGPKAMGQTGVGMGSVSSSAMGSTVGAGSSVPPSQSMPSGMPVSQSTPPATGQKQPMGGLGVSSEEPSIPAARPATTSTQGSPSLGTSSTPPTSGGLSATEESEPGDPQGSGGSASAM